MFELKFQRMKIILYSYFQLQNDYCMLRSTSVVLAAPTSNSFIYCITHSEMNKVK